MGCYARRLFYLLTNQNDYNIYQRENLGKIPRGIPPVAKHLGAGLLHYKECNNYMQCRPTLINNYKLGHTKFAAGPFMYDEQFYWNCAVPWPSLAISQKNLTETVLCPSFGLAPCL